MTTDAQRTAMVQYLNEYCFQKVWNSVTSEYRSNFALTPLKQRLQTNAITLTSAVVGLPTTGVYMTYYFDKSLLQASFALPAGKWYSLTDIVNQYNVKLSVYDAGGHLTPMHSTYIRHSAGGLYLVAIEYHAIMATIPTGFTTAFYMTVFKNPTDVTTTFSAYSTVVSNVSLYKAQLSTLGYNPTQTLFTVNGITYDNSNLPTLAVGDYVDIFIDPNIATEYVISVDDNTTGYMSTEYASYREILHCPKDLNPNQYIFTHDSATLIVRDVVTKKGVYLHRVDPVSVKQITHNDLSVSRDVLNGFKDALGGVANVEVIVKVRFHTNPQVLMTDSNWISDLYLNDDADIIQFLRGTMDSTMMFWSAPALESSGYVQMMFAIDDILDPSRLSNYVSALGYYSVAAILSANVYQGTYHNADMICALPYVLQTSDVIPLIYVNGRKILQSKLTTSAYSNYRIGINIASGIASEGDDVTIRILEYGATSPIRFTPTADTPSLVIPAGDMSVYLESQISPMSGYGEVSSVAYSLLTAGLSTFSISSNTDGTYTISFAKGYYGSTFDLFPSTYMFHQEISLDSYLSSVDSLVFPLYAIASDGTKTPLLGYTSSEFYINGYRLVENIDFVLNPLTTPEGTVFTDLVITNASFLDPSKTGNILEMFAGTSFTASTDIGYAKNNIMYRTSKPSVWYPQIATGFIEGTLVNNLNDYAVYMTASTSVPNGNVYMFKSTYPKIVSDALSDFSPLTDNQTIQAIDTYMGRTEPTPPTIIPVTMEHRIFSPFITAIAHDLIAGTLAIVDDPDDDSFLNQFSAYEYLKERDVALTNNGIVDRNFVAVEACYAQMPNTTIDIYGYIQRLIRLTLVTAGNNLGDTLV